MNYPCELVESRVDYLTMTSLKDSLNDTQSLERASELAFDLLYAEHRKGNNLVPWRSESFEGLQSGQICAGKNEHGLMIRLSGALADKHWNTLYQHATNVSRIDCAATFRLTDQWVDLSRLHHTEALDYQSERSPNLKVTRIDGGKHGCALNVGSRASEAYGRIYDKEAESKEEQYADCWRYEVEFKKKSALYVAARLSGAEQSELDPAAICLGWFQRRGVSTPPIGRDVAAFAAVCRKSDDRRRLDWVRSTVKPVIERLLGGFDVEELVEALGLDDKVEPKLNHIRSMSGL